MNPLKLDLLTPSIDEPENLLLPPGFQNETDSLNNALRRKRREVESVIESQEVEKGGIKRRITIMVITIYLCRVSGSEPNDGNLENHERLEMLSENIFLYRRNIKSIIFVVSSP